MPTLHQAVDETKALFKWGGITIATLIILVMVIRGGFVLKEIYYPTPLPPPTAPFGKIAPVLFPPSKVSKSFTYRIDTITGTLPIFTTQASVYKILQPQPNLLALQRAQNLVSQVGFPKQYTTISDTQYQWQSDSNTNPLIKRLTIDIFNNNFQLISSYLTNPQALPQSPLPSESDAARNAEQFLTNLASLPPDLDMDKTTTTLLAITNGQPSLATSLSSANVIRVDFFQKDIDKLPIYYPNPPNSTMHVIIGPSSYQGQVVEANYYHQTIDLDNSWASENDKAEGKGIATYPIITAQEAYDRLTQGQGYIASYFGNNTEIAVKSVALGYYIGDTPQGYVYPIIVFVGDDGFVAYVSALAPPFSP